MCDPSYGPRAPDDNGEEVRSGEETLCSNERIAAPMINAFVLTQRFRASNWLRAMLLDYLFAACLLPRTSKSLTG